MKIELRLFASLSRYLPDRQGGNLCAMEIPEGTTIKELLERLAIPTEIRKIIIVNGVHAGESQFLAEGDRIGVFPPVAGG
ncbi:MAG TPA: MoaD/ThiS family protein [Syntrophobacteria bacterium]|nr:MoaD/ThiS family protein [Syntrophobacteria bacterium]